MPMTEERKINKPIIISEDGHILSNKNKNEYLLPFLGIKNVQKNETNTNNKELFDNDINQIILNQTDLFKKSNLINISNYDIDLEKNMKNSLSMTNLNTKHNININEDNGVVKKNNQNNPNNIENNNYINYKINENINNNINNINNILNRNKSLLDNNNEKEGNLKLENKVYQDNLHI